MNNPPEAHRLQSVSEYIFSRLNKTLQDVEKESGRRVLNFGQGTPDIAPSPKYISQLVSSIKDQNSHLYPGYSAIPQLQDALIHWYEKRFHVTLTPQSVMPLLGAKDGISHIPLALLNENDEVLVPDPGYPAFSTPAVLIGAKPVFYALNEKNHFTLDLSEIEKKVTPRTKLLWVNFPSNPTGQIATLEELTELVTFAKNRNLFILYDNAYSEITFDGFIAPSILQVQGAQDIAVEIGSFSKSFSFAGFRMGYVVGNPKVIHSLSIIKSQMDSGLSLPLQKLGAYALTQTDTTWHKEMIETYTKRRNAIAPYLQSLDLTFTLTKGSLYIWAKIPDSALDSETFCMDLLHKKQILLTPGSAFGKNGERYVRVSIGLNIDHISEYF